MAYTDHFALVDDVTAHFDGLLRAVDPLFKSRYAGFYAVTSAAVLELALKDIVISFAQANGRMFGDYVAARYERINGRISIEDCEKEHLKPFGSRYRQGFKRRLRGVERYYLERGAMSLTTAYGNLLTCRHTFAHEGRVPATATYDELKLGFEAGKVVMHCLAKTLRYRGSP